MGFLGFGKKRGSPIQVEAGPDEEATYSRAEAAAKELDLEAEVADIIKKTERYERGERIKKLGKQVEAAIPGPRLGGEQARLEYIASHGAGVERVAARHQLQEKFEAKRAEDISGNREAVWLEAEKLGMGQKFADYVESRPEGERDAAAERFYKSIIASEQGKESLKFETDLEKARQEREKFKWERGEARLKHLKAGVGFLTGGETTTTTGTGAKRRTVVTGGMRTGMYSSTGMRPLLTPQLGGLKQASMLGMRQSTTTIPGGGGGLGLEKLRQGGGLGFSPRLLTGVSPLAQATTGGRTVFTLNKNLFPQAQSVGTAPTELKASEEVISQWGEQVFFWNLPNKGWESGTPGSIVLTRDSKGTYRFRGTNSQGSPLVRVIGKTLPQRGQKFGPGGKK